VAHSGGLTMTRNSVAETKTTRRRTVGHRCSSSCQRGSPGVREPHGAVSRPGVDGWQTAVRKTCLPGVVGRRLGLEVGASRRWR
jgi:hypothetical protein